MRRYRAGYGTLLFILQSSKTPSHRMEGDICSLLLLLLLLIVDVDIVVFLFVMTLLSLSLLVLFVVVVLYIRTFKLFVFGLIFFLSRLAIISY